MVEGGRSYSASESPPLSTGYEFNLDEKLEKIEGFISTERIQITSHVGISATISELNEEGMSLSRDGDTQRTIILSHCV